MVTFSHYYHSYCDTVVVSFLVKTHFVEQLIKYNWDLCHGCCVETKPGCVAGGSHMINMTGPTV